MCLTVCEPRGRTRTADLENHLPLSLQALLRTWKLLPSFQPSEGQVNLTCLGFFQFGDWATGSKGLNRLQFGQEEETKGSL